MTAAYLQCSGPACAKRQTAPSDAWQCPACGELLGVNYQFDSIDPSELRTVWRERRQSDDPADRSGVWRFRELLPFLEPRTSVVTLAEGGTPLVVAPRAAHWAGLTTSGRLAVKHQGANPTGSFKDTGMTACISRAVSRRVRVVACASTGNTSSSMAAYAARAGLQALLFVPYGQISAAKLAQAIDFGALVVEVGDTFDQAFALLREIAPELNLYLVNSVNPFRIEGQKTIIPELLEQRGWRVPHWIAVPGGNLGNTTAVGKGLRELKELGFIEAVPRIAVIQAEGANPFYRTLAAGSVDLIAVDEPRTEATAIRIGRPANWKKARRVLEWTEGVCEFVTDNEIFAAKQALAEDGIACEPASAASIAGLRRLCQAGTIGADADVVAILTGHQLKDPDYIMRHHAAERNGRRLRVEADLESVRRALRSIGLA